MKICEACGSNLNTRTYSDSEETEAKVLCEACAIKLKNGSLTIETVINGKYKLKLPFHRAIRPDWDIAKGGWETTRLDKLKEVTSKGSVVYDIGAEEGDISALLSIWSGGNIVLFEPNPLVWPNIKLIWESNNLPPPLGYFVGFASDTTNLQPQNLNIDMRINIGGFPPAANGQVISNHGFRHLAEESDATPQITLDDFVYGQQVYNKIAAPSILNIDVEGSELNVLKGAEKLLTNNAITVLVSVHPEFMYNYFGAYTSDLTNYMKAIGYKYDLLDFDHEYHFLFVKDS